MNMDRHYNAEEEDHAVLKRKSIRGGSWKDIAYFLQVSSRDYEYADSSRSYIGFRNVQDQMGTDVVLNQKLGDAR